MHSFRFLNYRFDANKSTKGASKLRRDLINAEIANLRDLLPLPQSTRQRLSQLQLMALVCVYVRKANYFQQGKNRRKLFMALKVHFCPVRLHNQIILFNICELQNLLSFAKTRSVLWTYEISWIAIGNWFACVFYFLFLFRTQMEPLQFSNRKTL